jgi:geranylgeranyl reductase family protein
LGHDVLLLDRQNFPRDKVCGDGIPCGVFEILYDYGMRQKVEQAGLYPVTKVRIVSPRNHAFDGPLIPSPRHGAVARVATREEFDALVQEHAVDMGAEFCRAKVEEPLIEDGQVKGVRARLNGKVEDMRAHIVIAADGGTSAVARALEKVSLADRHRAVALRAYVEGIDVLPHEVEFHLYQDILPGYGWIFPLGENRANVGLGMRLDIFRRRKENLKAMLQAFLELPFIKERLHNDHRISGIATWQLNFGSQKNLQRAFDGAMLVGDAGSFINPLTGGGIHNGMVSAQLAADVAHKALTKGDYSLRVLQEYDQACRKELWGGLSRSYLIQRWLLRFPILVDVLIRRANADGGQFARTFMEKL